MGVAEGFGFWGKVEAVEELLMEVIAGGGSWGGHFWARSTLMGWVERVCAEAMGLLKS